MGSKLDRNQYGGEKGNSITHYLVELVNFILYNQDLRVPQAVMATMVDFSKAFNRVDHNIVIIMLSEMGVPGWLLRIVASFLTQRKLIVRHKGLNSQKMSLPAGGPQGSILSCFIFIILINFAGIQPHSEPIGKLITKPCNKRQPMEKTNAKFVDDLTLAVSLNLKETLQPDHTPASIGPREFHRRTNHILPREDNIMQRELDEILAYSNEKKMKINQEKSNIMLFNTRKNFDFVPEVGLGSDSLQVVEVTKLLGVQIRSDLKWSTNTDYICSKGYSRLWMLRRLKALGAETGELLDIYKLQVISVLELAVPVWHPGLTQSEVTQIERVQKTALHIILGTKYTSYNEALNQSI